MNVSKLAAVLLVLCGFASHAAGSTSIVINPTATGSLYTCSGCNHSVANFLLVAGYIQGIVRFPTAQITGPITQATFTVNPSALPLGDLTVDVYGIASGTGTATYADAFAGVPLGQLILPPNLGFGQDASFDVTAFLASANVPYVGFNLRTNSGTDDFSSRSENYGHPSQLHVTFVPEPPTIALGVAALAALSTRRRKSVPQSRLMSADGSARL
jgi:hypothetical protein